MKDYELVSQETIFKGYIVELTKDVINLPDGKTAVREVVRHPGGSCVLPIDNDGNVILVRQYRHPIESMSLEIPAGLLEKGEDPLACATRELEEETGFKSDNIELLTPSYLSCGFSNEKIYIHLATNLQKGTVNLDDDEFVTVEKYSLAEALSMIGNEIQDAKTIIALTMYHNRLLSEK